MSSADVRALSAAAEEIPALIAKTDAAVAFDYHARRVDLLRTVHHYRERVAILDATWAQARHVAAGELRDAETRFEQFERTHARKPWGGP